MERCVYRYMQKIPAECRVPFRVYSHGINEDMPFEMVEQPALTPNWLFIYLHDSAEIISKKYTGSVEPGTLMFWEPYEQFQYGNPAAPWSHSWLQCTGLDVPGILKENGLELGRPVLMPRPVLVERYLMRIFREVSAHREPDQRLLQNVFHNWIIEMSRVVRHTDSDRPPAPESLEAAKRYMDLHLDERITLVQMAQMSHLSVSHFSALFRLHYGSSPIDYQISRRMNYARHLLELPGRSVAEIAELTGYDDLYQFSRMFKKRLGKSPTVYRRSYLGSFSTSTIR